MSEPHRIALLAFATLTAACGGSSRGAPGNALTAAAERTPEGARVYKSECGGCHGARGEGTVGGPRLMGQGALRAFRTAAELHTYVREEMPLPKKRVGTLKPEEYWAVVNFMLLANDSAVPEAGVTAENAASVALQR